MTYSERIIKLRWKMLLTQHEFANVLGVSLPAVSKWENSKSEPSDHSKEKLNILFIRYNITDEKDPIFSKTIIKKS